jgi:hypothetical protein
MCSQRSLMRSASAISRRDEAISFSAVARLASTERQTSLTRCSSGPTAGSLLAVTSPVYAPSPPARQMHLRRRTYVHLALSSVYDVNFRL